MPTPATISCRRCGRRVTGEAPRCPECGADPRTGRSAYRGRDADKARVCQGVGPRLAAHVVDLALLLLSFIVVSYAVYLVMAGAGEFAVVGEEPTSLPFWAAFLAGSFLYFWLCEGLWGRTLGKRLLDLRVVRADGGPAGLRRALVRTALRPVDALPFAYLLGACAVWLTRRRQRLGDLVAGTVVVRPRMVPVDRLADPAARVVPWRAAGTALRRAGWARPHDVGAGGRPARREDAGMGDPGRCRRLQHASRTRPRGARSRAPHPDAPLPLLAAALVVLVILGAAYLAPDAGAAHGAARPTSAGAAPTPPPVWVATPARPARVWVGGDSLGGELVWGLRPLLDDAGVFETAGFYKESSGICRYDFFDWRKKMTAVTRTPKRHIVCIMLGSNDTQPVWTTAGWIPYGTAAWKTAYGRRVGKLMDLMLERGTRRVYWVGMPIMREKWRNPRMKAVNSIVRAQAGKRPGVRYINVWSLFADKKGRYVAKWRASDGVHFTRAGWQRLSARVYRSVARDWLPAPAASPP